MEEAPRIVPLGDQHDRGSFECGTQELDEYLRRRARQDRDRHVAAVFVLEGDPPSRIAGYYTLSALSIRPDQLTPELARKLPRYPVLPATLLGRLAVDLGYRGRGYGALLLMDALQRILSQSRQVASLAAVVDAKDEAARRFYEKYGFCSVPDDPQRLFLPVRTIEAMFASR